MRIIYINLGILLFYSLVIFLLNYEPTAVLLLTMALLVSFQCFVNVLLSIIFLFRKERQRAGYFAISAVLVALIGLGSCIGSGSLKETLRTQNAPADTGAFR